MSIDLFDYSPITERPPIEWPDGARVAFYVGLNVEHFELGKPSTTLFEHTAGLDPDPLNHGWRDYGARVGIWRMIDAFDRIGVRPSVLLNSDVAERYPQIIRAGIERDWAWLAHGKTNSVLQAGMSVDEERRFLAEVTETIERATGSRPRGWMGPGLTETHATPGLLAELGYEYVLDWTNDDQPYELNVPGMFSLPYTVEVNDLAMFTAGKLTGPQGLQVVKDQFDQLYADSADSGRVMSLALHPFVSGQPFRHRYVAEAIEYIVGHEGVWTTTSDAIVERFRALRG
jgi:peptidoglycan/xylan/chitin deacetylase (PgdA/CDA1 family)